MAVKRQGGLAIDGQGDGGQLTRHHPEHEKEGQILRVRAEELLPRTKDYSVGVPSVDDEEADARPRT